MTMYLIDLVTVINKYSKLRNMIFITSIKIHLIDLDFGISDLEKLNTPEINLPINHLS